MSQNFSNSFLISFDSVKRQKSSLERCPGEFSVEFHSLGDYNHFLNKPDPDKRFLRSMQSQRQAGDAKNHSRHQYSPGCDGDRDTRRN